MGFIFYKRMVWIDTDLNVSYSVGFLQTTVWNPALIIKIKGSMRRFHSFAHQNDDTVMTENISFLSESNSSNV